MFIKYYYNDEANVALYTLYNTYIEIITCFMIETVFNFLMKWFIGINIIKTI